MTLADRVRERAAEIHAAAVDRMVADLRAAAGDAFPADALSSSIAGFGTSVYAGVVSLENAQAVTVWQWTVGEPQRPYDPHQALNGITFTSDDWRDVLASPGEFGAPYYFPLDHEGCQCEVTNVVGELVFDPPALDARPVTIRAFGQTIVALPGAPELTTTPPAWWTSTLTPEAWAAALTAAASD